MYMPHGKQYSKIMENLAIILCPRDITGKSETGASLSLQEGERKTENRTQKLWEVNTAQQKSQWVQSTIKI